MNILSVGFLTCVLSSVSWAQMLVTTPAKYFEFEWKSPYAPIRIKADADSALFIQNMNQLEQWTNRFSHFFQRNGPLDSLIFNAKKGDTLQLDSMTLNLLRFGLNARKVTQDDVDIGIGNLIDAWGLNWGGKKKIPSDSLRRRLVNELKKPPFTLTQSGIIINRSHVHLSLGSYLESRILSQIANTLLNCHTKNFLIEVGGDFQFLGKNPQNKPWTLAIKDPTHPSQVLATLTLDRWHSGGFSTSGNYEQNFVDSLGHFHHHIFNPKTGESTTGPLAVSVLSPNPMTNDLLDTWFMIAPFNTSRSYIKSHSDTIHAFIVQENHQIWISPQLKKSISNLAPGWKIIQ
jgi:thiamine biosynthesis lipoprotein ApbE